MSPLFFVSPLFFERRRLALTGTASLFQLLLELIDLSRKLRHALLQAEACWAGERHEFSVAVC
jgi:hypothetical protein